MPLAFRTHHALKILETALELLVPVDLLVYNYFKNHKALGSKDRKEIREKVFKFIKWRDLITYLSPDPSLEKQLIFSETLDPFNLLTPKEIPPAIRCSCPAFLFERLKKQYGSKEALALGNCFNTEAPSTLRVNTQKISRKKLIEKLQTSLQIRPSPFAPEGIELLERAALFQTEEFKKGFFEMQDEGSQLLAELVQTIPGDLVLDYCSGSGGKSLALAPKMCGKGQIFLHDIRLKALKEAKIRFKRAGIQHVQFLNSEAKNLKKLKKKMDWVLVDAPCSGTGTLRRNPDMKYRLTPQMLHELIGKQRHIFEKALSYVKEGGKIVYATCSLLEEENQRQVDFFLKHFPLKVDNTPFISLPEKGKMDGFFGQVFERIKPLKVKH